jgi:fructosamine-3-kinase
VTQKRSAAAWTGLATQIGECTGRAFAVRHAEPAAGGCINEAWVLSDGERRFFVKLAAAGQLGMFEAELAGLGELAQAGAVRVPRPICAGRDAQRAWLVIEHLDLSAASRRGWALLGAGLATQHRRLGAKFGWHRDNTIGSTPQPNAWSADWTVFLREHRLGYQLRLAETRGFGRELAAGGARLLERLALFFPGYSPQASLLHGDLWSGNVAFLPDGQPVIFDPAVYYGDREADLAMTELFGGFGGEFYSAYAAAWPLDAGYPVRRQLYNLYHLLNHLNLFGAGYLGRCRSTIDWLLGQARARDGVG